MTQARVRVGIEADDKDVAAPHDPYVELRIVGLSATRGANYWSTRAITRLDLAVGAYDDVSSADVDGFTDRLVAVLPGLEGHRCSIGERGGFITRLHRGTYAPHIVEHVALELQTMIGHDVGYGRSRGGDEAGEYTVIFEHRHEATGRRAATLAVDLVQQLLAGRSATIGRALTELRLHAARLDAPPLTPHVVCAVSGGLRRGATRREIIGRLACRAIAVVEVNPADVLQTGLPYARSDLAVIIDEDLGEVPARYRDPERASRLLAVLTDALPPGGVLIAPAKSWALQDAARENGCGVAVFSGGPDVSARDRRVARSAAWVREGEILIEHRGRLAYREPRRADVEPAVQAAAALAQFTMVNGARTYPA